MTFAETRFPADISYGSGGGPEYATGVVALQSGHEQRNVNWATSRARYNVAHGVKTGAQLAALIAFFRARKGRAHGFRFKDWTDYQAAGQMIGTGDGSETGFQLVKHYDSGGVRETRIITKPVAGTVSIYIDSIAQLTGWEVNGTTGIVAFDDPPAEGAVVAADFEFDVPVRFETDRLSASLDAYGSHSWNDIPLVEIRV